MALITKAEAATLRTSYIAQLPARLDAALRAAAQSGVVSITFSYAPASPAAATTFQTNTIELAGWTVVRDDVGFTFTIS